MHLKDSYINWHAITILFQGIKYGYGKIKGCMEKDLNTSAVMPPRLIPTFVAGFNAVASHIYLILFPVLLDLLLWLGPLVRIKNLIQPVFENAAQQMVGLYPADTLTLMQTSKDSIIKFFENFNLLFTLRTLPIGIPSLMVGIAPLNNPLGNLSIVEMVSTSQAWSVVLGSLVAGLCLGCFFFSLVARVVAGKKLAWDVNIFFLQLKNTFILSLLLLGFGLVLSLPTLLLLSAVVSFLPSLGSIPVMILGAFLVWMLLPMVFSVHGIFMGQLNPLSSVGNSIRLVKRYLPGTGLFFLVAVLLSQGLDMLWATPVSNQWMSLVGILGHGFIATGVLAASFVYFSSGMEYMREKIRRDSAKLEIPAHTGN
jgi:hypothetical protein